MNKLKNTQIFGAMMVVLGALSFIAFPQSKFESIPTTQCLTLNSWQDYITEFKTWNYKGMSGQYDSEHPANPPTAGYVIFSNPHIGGYSGSCGDGTCNLPYEQDTTNAQFYCPQDCSTALLLVGDVAATNGMKCSEYITSYKDGILLSEYYKTLQGISVFKGVQGSDFTNSLIWCDPTDKFMFIAKPTADDIVELYSSKLCKAIPIPTTTTTIENRCWSNSHCIWCGRSCVKYQTGMQCPMVAPPIGSECKCVFNPPQAETGKCQEISSSTVCCHSFGYGSGMQKCCDEYKLMPISECKTPEGYTGGGKEIVDDLYCENLPTTTLTTTTSTTTTTICLPNINGCGSSTTTYPITTTTFSTTTTIPPQPATTFSLGETIGSIMGIIGLGLIFLW